MKGRGERSLHKANGQLVRGSGCGRVQRCFDEGRRRSNRQPGKRGHKQRASMSMACEYLFDPSRVHPVSLNQLTNDDTTGPNTGGRPGVTAGACRRASQLSRVRVRLPYTPSSLSSIHLAAKAQAQAKGPLTVGASTCRCRVQGVRRDQGTWTARGCAVTTSIYRSMPASQLQASCKPAASHYKANLPLPLSLHQHLSS